MDGDDDVVDLFATDAVAVAAGADELSTVGFEWTNDGLLG